MKPKFGREIALLALPVLLIGGAGLMASRNGRTLLPAWMKQTPFDPGPIRVEFSPLQPIPATPFDVADGYEWAATTTAEQRGTWKMPPGWKAVGGSTGFPSRLELVYRQGKQWKIAPRQRVGRGVVTTNLNANTNLTTLKVDLDAVPQDADEVRLQGEFSAMESYSGTIPPGWKPPPNLRIMGVNRILTLKSKPFDIQIKAPGEPMPAPEVSHEPKVELVDAVWFTEHFSNGDIERFFLHLRHTGERKWPRTGPRVRQVRVFDAAGEPLALFGKNGAGKRPFNEFAGWFNQGLFDPNKLPTDLITAIWSDDTAPRGGWAKVKQPIRVEMEISDSNCWPRPARIQLRHRDAFDEKSFGAPDAELKP